MQWLQKPLFRSPPSISRACTSWKHRYARLCLQPLSKTYLVCLTEWTVWVLLNRFPIRSSSIGTDLSGNFREKSEKEVVRDFLRSFLFLAPNSSLEVFFPLCFDLTRPVLESKLNLEHYSETCHWMCLTDWRHLRNQNCSKILFFIGTHSTWNVPLVLGLDSFLQSDSNPGQLGQKRYAVSPAIKNSGVPRYEPMTPGWEDRTTSTYCA